MDAKSRYLAALRAGMNKKTAARVAGVDPAMTWRWSKASAIHRLKVEIAIGAARMAAVERFREFMEASR